MFRISEEEITETLTKATNQPYYLNKEIMLNLIKILKSFISNAYRHKKKVRKIEWKESYVYNSDGKRCHISRQRIVFDKLGNKYVIIQSIDSDHSHSTQTTAKYDSSGNFVDVHFDWIS